MSLFTFFQILEAAGKDVCVHVHTQTHTRTSTRTEGVSTLSSKPEILHLNSEREVWKWNTPGYIKTLPRIWTQVLSIWHGAAHVSSGIRTTISNAYVYILYTRILYRCYVQRWDWVQHVPTNLSTLTMYSFYSQVKFSEYITLLFNVQVQCNTFRCSLVCKINVYFIVILMYFSLKFNVLLNVQV